MSNDKFPEKWEEKPDKESSDTNSWIDRFIQIKDKVNQIATQKPRLFELSTIGVVALILIAVMPLVLSDFRLDLLHRYLALAIVALGIDLIWGYTGLLSLGHGIFFALGDMRSPCISNYKFLKPPAVNSPTSWDSMG